MLSQFLWVIIFTDCNQGVSWIVFLSKALTSLSGSHDLGQNFVLFSCRTKIFFVLEAAKWSESCSALSYSLPPVDSTVCGILQARILECVAVPSPGLLHCRRILYQPRATLSSLRSLFLALWPSHTPLTIRKLLFETSRRIKHQRWPKPSFARLHLTESNSPRIISL